MSKPKKILILGDANSSHTSKWCSILIENGYEVFLFSFYPQKIESKINGVNTFCYFNDNKITKGKKLSYLFAYKRVRKIIKDHQIDTLHAYYATSYGLIGALAKPKRFFLSFLGTDVFVFPKKSAFHKRLIRYVINKADKVFSSSEVMKREIEKYTSKDVFLIYYGVDTSVYYPKNTEKSLNKEKIKLGIVKTLAPIYRIDVAIEAIDYLNKNSTYSFELHICGEGPLLDELKQKAVNNVRFLGKLKQEEVPAFMNTLDVYINSTDFESFGVSTIEAMACGVPVVAHDAGGSSEIIEHDVDGVLYKPNTAEELAKGILSILNSEEGYNKLKINGLKKIQDKYNLKRNAEAYINHLEEA